ncbi:LOW QUALITY PROTEIN: isocitrate dehydrogenase [NAD] subunit beta, mitochondrial-like [Rhinoraja longicauda]
MAAALRAVTRRLSVPAVGRAAGRYRVTMIPGDGVGPELMHAVKEVFQAGEVPVVFEEHHVSEIQNLASDQKLEQLLSSMKDTRVAIKGQGSAAGSPSVRGVVECLKIITREKSRRIAKFAFDFATKNGRHKVTAVHKANIMKLSDGLFLQCCREMADLYPNIIHDSIIIDNCCMQLVSDPHQFDVLVMPNLYGNIIDNLAAGLVGGAGVVPGESFSSEYVVYETGARHPFSQAMGRNIANPTAMLLSAANMLRHLNLEFHSKMVAQAVRKVIKTGQGGCGVRTQDMGGYSTSAEFTAAVITNLKS